MRFELTEQQETLRRDVRSFAQSEITPLAIELDQQEELENIGVTVQDTADTIAWISE